MGTDPFLIGMAINLIGSVLINVGTNAIKYYHHLNTQFRRVSVTNNESLGDQPPPPLSHSVSTSPQPLSPGGASSGSGSSGADVNPVQVAPITSCCRPITSRLRCCASSPPASGIAFWWWFGFLAFFVGNVMNFVSFGFAAQSLLAGLGSIQFLSNIVCSVAFMNQKITSRIFWATLLIIAGNLLIVVFASHQSPKLSVEELEELYQNTAYQVYIIILIVSAMSLELFYRQAKKKMRQDVLAGKRPSHLLSRLLPFAYAAISGIIGTQSVLLAKSCSELVRTTISGDNQFIYTFTYVIILAWVSSMIFWLYRMNNALRKFDGVFIIPVLQVVWTLFSIVGGGIYFREFDNFNGTDIGLFTFGVLIVIFGVYLLAPTTTGHSALPPGQADNDHRGSSIMTASPIVPSPHHHSSLSLETSSATSSPAIGPVHTVRFTPRIHQVSASPSPLSSMNHSASRSHSSGNQASHLLRYHDRVHSPAGLSSSASASHINRLHSSHATLSSRAVASSNQNAYDDLELLPTHRGSSSSLSSIEMLRGVSEGASSGTSSMFNANSIYNDDPQSLALENEDTFSINLSPALATRSMPVTPQQASRGLRQLHDQETRQRGMSLGFSMPMIDLESEQI